MFKTYERTETIEALLLTHENILEVARKYKGMIHFGEMPESLVVGGVTFYPGDLVYKAPNGTLQPTDPDFWKEA